MRTSVMCAVPVLLSAMAGIASGQVVSAGVVVLESGAVDGALTVSGEPIIQTTMIQNNSTGLKAVTGSGSARLECYDLRVAGRARFTGSSTCTGRIYANSAAMSDPFSTMAMPAAASSGPSMTIEGGAAVLEPGTYDNLLFRSTADVVLNPGVYHVLNGFRVTGEANVRGDGVTIVMHGGDLTFAGTGDVWLTPPEDGPTAGFTIIQPSSNSTAMSLSGDSSFLVHGTIYVPNATVNVSGQAGVGEIGPLFGVTLVVDQMKVSGNGIVRLGQRPITPPDAGEKQD